MTPDLPHILIVEPEFLIALDAEYLIKAALDCRITLQRPEQVDHWDFPALAGIDLCLLDLPNEAGETVARIQRLVDAGETLELVGRLAAIVREPNGACETREAGAATVAAPTPESI